MYYSINNINKSVLLMSLICLLCLCLLFACLFIDFGGNSLHSKISLVLIGTTNIKF